MKHDIAQVPFFVHEASMARAERSQKRLLAAFLTALVIDIGCIAIMARKGL